MRPSKREGHIPSQKKYNLQGPPLKRPSRGMTYLCVGPAPPPTPS